MIFFYFFGVVLFFLFFIINFLRLDVMFYWVVGIVGGVWIEVKKKKIVNYKYIVSVCVSVEFFFYRYKKVKIESW